jgi:hypothetical protein
VSITTGTYKPTDSGTASDTFSASAPAEPYGSTLSVFNGTNPAGIWSLYVMDDRASNTGSISGGWRLSLEITAPSAPPASLSYASNPATYTKDTTIPDNTPTSSGGAVVSYAVSPALPTGLTLNTYTGVISGTPTALSAAANYTITATNMGGSTTAAMNISVVSAYTAWAAQYNLVESSQEDSDGDGNANYFEFIAGLDPKNASSVFTLRITPVSGQVNQMVITFKPIVSGRIYTLKSSDSLAPGSWTTLSGSTSSDLGNERSVLDATAAGARRFYRVEIEYP